MKTKKLEAILECDVRVVSITKIAGHKRVWLEIDGKLFRFKEGDTTRIELKGKFDRD